MAPFGGGGDMGLSPWRGISTTMGLVDKGEPTEEEEAASITRGIAWAGLHQDHPAAPISPLSIFTQESLRKRESLHPENGP